MDVNPHASDPNPSQRKHLHSVVESRRKPAAAIAAPTAPGSVYVQAEAQSAVAAINAIRTALKDAGITL